MHCVLRVQGAVRVRFLPFFFLLNIQRRKHRALGCWRPEAASAHAAKIAYVGNVMPLRPPLDQVFQRMVWDDLRSWGNKRGFEVVDWYFTGSTNTHT